MSNSLDPDQARRFVGPDLGPNCLPRLSADDTGRQRVNDQNRQAFVVLFNKNASTVCITNYVKLFYISNIIFNTCVMLFSI